MARIRGIGPNVDGRIAGDLTVLGCGPKEVNFQLWCHHYMMRKKTLAGNPYFPYSGSRIAGYFSKNSDEA